MLKHPPVRSPFSCIWKPYSPCGRPKREPCTWILPSCNCVKVTFPEITSPDGLASFTIAFRGTHWNHEKSCSEDFTYNKCIVFIVNMFNKVYSSVANVSYHNDIAVSWACNIVNCFMFRKGHTLLVMVTVCVWTLNGILTSVTFICALFVQFCRQVVMCT